MPSHFTVAAKAAGDVTNKAGVLATLDLQVTALINLVNRIDGFSNLIEQSWPVGLSADVKSELVTIQANINVVRTGINANLT